MRLFATGIATALLTLRECQRSRLWVLVALAAIAVAVLLPSLNAVDQSAQRKLGLVVASGASGLLALVLAVLVAPMQLRRDLDQRIAITLLAKPASRLGYLLGRWVGTVLFLCAAQLALGLVALAALAFAFRDSGGLPAPRMLTAPTTWSQVSPLGEVVAVNADAPRNVLSGPAGNAVRVRFAHVAAADVPAEGLSLFVQARVKIPHAAEGGSLIEVTALPGDRAPLRLLPDAATPYGLRLGDRAPPAGSIVLLDREPARSDLDRDFLHLRVPAAAIAGDDSLTVQILRRDSSAVLIFAHDSACRLAHPGGPLLLSLLAAAGVTAAVAGLIVAAVLFAAVHGSYATSLLAGLSLIIAGHAVWTVREVLAWQDGGLVRQRLLELLLAIVPDFDRAAVGPLLASGQAIGLAQVLSAWTYFGVFTAILLALAWRGLVRREL